MNRKYTLISKKIFSYPSAPVNFQEPEMTNHECTWLEQRGIIVRKTRSMVPPKMDKAFEITSNQHYAYFFHSVPNRMSTSIFLPQPYQSDGAAFSKRDRGTIC